MTLDTKRDLIAACVYGHMVMVRGGPQPRVPRSQSYPNAWQGDKDRCLECADDILIISDTTPSYDTLKERVAALETGLRVGATFLGKCGSAWASGEPEHRVREMLAASETFAATLETLLMPETSNGK